MRQGQASISLPLKCQPSPPTTSFHSLTSSESDRAAIPPITKSHVTAEMMLARRSTCYFVVYTLAPDMYIEKISLDEDFFMNEMLPKLHDFFEQHYLPVAATDIAK